MATYQLSTGACCSPRRRCCRGVRGWCVRVSVPRSPPLSAMLSSMLFSAASWAKPAEDFACSASSVAFYSESTTMLRRCLRSGVTMSCLRLSYVEPLTARPAHGAPADATHQLCHSADLESNLANRAGRDAHPTRQGAGISGRRLSHRLLLVQRHRCLLFRIRNPAGAAKRMAVHRPAIGLCASGDRQRIVSSDAVSSLTATTRHGQELRT